MPTEERENIYLYALFVCAAALRVCEVAIVRNVRIIANSVCGDVPLELGGVKWGPRVRRVEDEEEKKRALVGGLGQGGAREAGVGVGGSLVNTWYHFINPRLF